MRRKVIRFLKTHPVCVSIFWWLMRRALWLAGLFVRQQPRTMLFMSLGGRQFADSPRAIYEEVCRREAFADWRLIWAFAEPEKHEIPRGEKVRIDTAAFFRALLESRVWVSNSGMTRGIGFSRRGVIKVETWHGTPLKKIGTEQHSNVIGSKKRRRRADAEMIRTAQSEYDRDIFQRVFNAPAEAFLMCDLPRNDVLAAAGPADTEKMREKLGIPTDKKALLYMPTYREFQTDGGGRTYLAPPMDLKKWREHLGGEFVLLVRAHYAVEAALGIRDDDFVRDVSSYPDVNDLYIAADELISDYSGAFVDYAILERPMHCFAYDLEEYAQKRGLYMDLEKTLPCPVDRDEDALLAHIERCDREAYVRRTAEFRKSFAPHAGHASQAVADEILRRLS